MSLVTTSLTFGFFVGAAVLLLECLRLARAFVRFRALELAIPGPASLPLLGNLFNFYGVTQIDLFRRLLTLLDKKGKVSRLSFVGNLIVIVNRPADIDAVLKHKDLTDKSHYIYDRMHVVAKKGLLQMSGPHWRLHRRVLQPAFHNSVLTSLVGVFGEEAEGFVQRVVPCKDENVYDNLRRTMVGVFLRTTLDEHMGANFEEEVMGMMHFFDVYMLSLNERWFQPLLWSDVIFGMTASGRLIRRMKAKVDDYARMVLNRRRDELRHQGDDVGGGDFFSTRRRTLVDILVAPKSNKGDYEMPDEEIIDEFKTFFGASIDTTAVTLAWTFKLLSLRPQMQQRVVDEIEDVFGGSSRVVTSDDLPRLEYMERFVKETLRMFPSIPFVARHMKKEGMLCGHTVPADSTVVINIFGAHRDPEHWPDPLRFDPDRFQGDVGRHPSAYMPFSLGPRNCIGGKYAMMSIKTILVTTLRSFRVDPVHDDGHATDIADFPLTFDMALRHVGGFRVSFTPRVAKGA